MVYAYRDLAILYINVYVYAHIFNRPRTIGIVDNMENIRLYVNRMCFDPSGLGLSIALVETLADAMHVKAT